MEAKELKEGGRYVRLDGSVTPPLVKSTMGFGWLTDEETGADYSPHSPNGHLFHEFAEEPNDLDLVAVYVEAEEAA